MCKSLTLFFLLAFLAFGCSSTEDFEIPEHLREVENLTVYPADVKPVYSIYFERDASFGDTEDVIFGSLGSMAVDEMGRVFIADGSQLTIHIFLPDGRYSTSIGREGSGPEEFRRISDLQIQTRQMFVYDRILQRIVVFSLYDSLRDQGSVQPPVYSHAVSFIPERWRDVEELTESLPNQFFARSDDTILTGFSQMVTPEERYLRYYLMDKEGRIISDKVLKKQDVDIFATTTNEGSYALRLPFNRKPLIAVSDDGDIYSAYSDEFLVRRYDPDEGYKQAFYYVHSKSDMNRRDILSLVHENTRRVLQEAEFPEFWPVLEKMLIDDENRLWIATITDDEENLEWRVLDVDGLLLTKFTWPGNRLSPFYQSDPLKEIVTIKNGHLYTRETDDMGVASIVRYRIEMEEI